MKKFLSILASAAVLALPLVSMPASAQAPAVAPAQQAAPAAKPAKPAKAKKKHAAHKVKHKTAKKAVAK